MDRDTKDHMVFVLSTLMEFFPGGQRAERWEEETGNTVEELDVSMKHLGKRCDMDAGVL